MTQLVDKAFLEVSKLPPNEQNLFASQMLDELASEKRWTQMFEETQDVLADLASEALAEHQAGKTEDRENLSSEIKNNGTL